MIEYQSPRNQTLYADLLQEALVDTMSAGTGLSFNKKQVKGNPYWYLSVAIGRARRQTFIGRDTPELRARIEAQRAEWNRNRNEHRGRAELVRLLVRSGTMPISPAQAKIIGLLADSGVFLAGGVVVGSVAFAAYANMLGVTWPAGNVQRQGIDIAGDRLQVAVSKEGVDLKDISENTQMGFRPVPPLNAKHPETQFSMGRGQIQVDILTPMKNRTSPAPIPIPRLGVYAEPVRFLEFLLVDTQQAILLGRSGILANVPSPGRFALHKLVVAARRQGTRAAKIRNDIAQASQLIEVLVEDMPAALVDAYEAAGTFHKKFQQQIRVGMGRLPVEIHSGLAKTVGISMRRSAVTGRSG